MVVYMGLSVIVDPRSVMVARSSEPKPAGCALSGRL